MYEIYLAELSTVFESVSISCQKRRSSNSLSLNRIPHQVDVYRIR